MSTIHDVLLFPIPPLFTFAAEEHPDRADDQGGDEHSRHYRGEV